MNTAWHDAPSGRNEDEGHFRGVGYLLLTVPLGVAVWLFVWQLGIVTSLVPFGVAIVAVYLYRYGSGGTMPARGIVAVVLVLLVTVALGLAGSFVYDAHRVYPLTETNGGVFEHLGAAFGDAGFWDWFWQVQVPASSTWEVWVPNILIALLFAALGAVPALTLAYLGARDRLTSSGAFITTSIIVSIAGLLTFALGPVTIDLPSSEAELSVEAEPRVVGDCLEPPAEELIAGEFVTIPLPVDCAESHWGEVVRVGTVDEAVDIFPGEQRLGTLALDQCSGPFLDFIGTPLDQTTLSVQTFFPSEESWATGDRATLCLAVDPSGSNVGTLAGSAL